MSHSMGKVTLEDGTKYYCEYNGTVDIMLPFLYKTPEEVHNNWRRRDWINCNNPEHKQTKVKIYSDYGYGFDWDGTICIECMCIIGPLEPDYNTITDYDENSRPEL